MCPFCTGIVEVLRAKLERLHGVALEAEISDGCALISKSLSELQLHCGDLPLDIGKTRERRAWAACRSLVRPNAPAPQGVGSADCLSSRRIHHGRARGCQNTEIVAKQKLSARGNIMTRRENRLDLEVMTTYTTQRRRRCQEAHPVRLRCYLQVSCAGRSSSAELQCPACQCDGTAVPTSGWRISRITTAVSFHSASIRAER